jgi:hypothetical protein
LEDYTRVVSSYSLVTKPIDLEKIFGSEDPKMAILDRSALPESGHYTGHYNIKKYELNNLRR